jgi:hypothetical protein
VPNVALANAPSIYTLMGLVNLEGALIPGAPGNVNQRLRRFLRTLLLYQAVGALGKVRLLD